jgi:hypothetical protein
VERGEGIGLGHGWITRQVLSCKFGWLVRKENTGATSHVVGIITVGEDGNKLVMTFPTNGTTQEWIRVDG